MEPDFSGYATRNDLECSDGRTIMADSFKHQHQQKVPLVWNHQHNDPTNILGHAILEHREDGVYTRAYFNDTAKAQEAKESVRHGDITQLSIFANKLVQQGKNVLHGMIREVSLVLAGANPGAFIDNYGLAHGDYLNDPEDQAIIYTGLDFELAHADNSGDTVADTKEKTVEDVFNELTDEQKRVVAFIIGEAVDEEKGDDTEDKEPVKHSFETDDTQVQAVFNTLDDSQQQLLHFLISEALTGKDEDPNLQHGQEGTSMSNVFESAAGGTATLAHAKAPRLTEDQLQTIIKDGIKVGSFKESFLSHADDYGITNIDLMFPDAKFLQNTPELLARQTEWVQRVLSATKHSPIAKVKTLIADLTPEAARAKGYVKGTMKKDEVLSLMKRSTGPATVYKKQKLDRDDIIDITDFDVIMWLKWEMRFMLDEELARAILLGDGRQVGDDDKVKDPQGQTEGTGIRSIANDHEMFAVKVDLPANVSATDQIDAITRARTDYRGSGNPTMYTTDKTVSDLLLLKDKMGRRLYGTEAELASAMRVKEIVAVEAMSEYPTILAIVVNLTDYTLGSSKGGEVSFFEDFDLDFNQKKMLIETRLSGALTKPRSALVIRRALGTKVVPVAPSFDGPTNTITIPTVAGVEYFIDGTLVTGDKIIAKDTEVNAEAATGNYIEAGVVSDWNYIYTPGE